MAKAPVDPEVEKLKAEKKKFKEEQKKDKKEQKARIHGTCIHDADRKYPCYKKRKA